MVQNHEIITRVFTIRRHSDSDCSKRTEKYRQNILCSHSKHMQNNNRSKANEGMIARMLHATRDNNRGSAISAFLAQNAHKRQWSTQC